MRRSLLTLAIAVLFSPLSLCVTCRPFVLVLSQDDLREVSNSGLESDSTDSSTEWDEFPDSNSKFEHDLDLGSNWRSLFENETRNGD